MEVTGRAKELLQAIRESSEWVTRADLAMLTGKKRLSPHDRNLLDDLETNGLIETDEKPAGISTKFVYKAK